MRTSKKDRFSQTYYDLTNNLMNLKLFLFSKKFRKKLKDSYLTKKNLPILMGFIATLWFLIRVVPKPSRAGYPCMKIAYPIMSGFVMWLIGIIGIISSYKMIFRGLCQRKKVISILGFITLMFIVVFYSIQNALPTNAQNLVFVYHPSNIPFGNEQGILPGRVTWAWDTAATNESCTNDLTKNDGYFLNKNNNQEVIDGLVNQSILRLTNQNNLPKAWDTLFKFFNNIKGKGTVGYQAGEIVFIKINMGTAGWASQTDFTRWSWAKGYSETSPQVVLSIIKGLTQHAGIAQNNIIIADPIAHIYQDFYTTIQEVFPDIIFGDKDYSTFGRTQLSISENPCIFYSDKGSVLDTDHEYLYTELENAEYLINIAALKAHARAGISLTAKNHFGSHTRNSAQHLHPGLIAPNENIPVNKGYGLYRTQVDLMGSKYLGKNTMLYIVDGLWGGTEATEVPVKWNMSPFNTDWPNSIFMSQDQVALESVCFDFLRYEATINNKFNNRPNFDQGVDDYLHQASSSEHWPNGIIYDPDNQGTPIPSLGVHEHWNNPKDKQYSRNLGEDYGIELIQIVPKQLLGSNFVAYDLHKKTPIFDGIADDSIWTKASWQYIDQVWIPYGEDVAYDNFSGRYKVFWSSHENKIFVLVETTDNDYIDGYVYPNTNYPDYDILEIFIDEDQSGGLHVFDNSTDWGENAENAFSYHIAINFPEEGETTSEKHVLDIAGKSWSDRQTPDYADHFPEFIVRREGNKLTWEFSFYIYDDTYDPTKTAAQNNGSLVTLMNNRTIGMALAYCDADETVGRDYFLGSDWGPDNGGEFNNYWKLADNYTTVTLNSNYIQEDPISSEQGDTVKAIYIDEHSAMWIGTDLGLLREKDNIWTAINTQYQAPGQVNDIKPQSTQYGMEIWMANHHGTTVASYNVDGVSGATLYNSDKTALESDIINAVEVDEKGARFFATENGVGIFKGSEWSFFNQISDVKEVSYTDLKGKGDTIYISTFGKGVARLVHETDGITGATSYVKPWSALPSDSVNCVFIDSKGYQWYGTTNGIVRHTSSEAKEGWDTYLSEESLPNKHINCINEDPGGNIWLGSKGGLIKLENNQQTLKHYTTTDGLPHHNINTIYIENASSIWLGTDKGLAHFDGSSFTNVLTSNYTTNFIDIIDPSKMHESLSDIKILSVFPNPATEYVVFKNRNFDGSLLDISIYNFNGSLIKRWNQHGIGETVQWNLKDFNNNRVEQGNYFVIIRSKEVYNKGKFVVL